MAGMAHLMSPADKRTLRRDARHSIRPPGPASNPCGTWRMPTGRQSSPGRAERQRWPPMRALGHLMAGLCRGRRMFAQTNPASAWGGCIAQRPPTEPPSTRSHPPHTPYLPPASPLIQCQGQPRPPVKWGQVGRKGPSRQTAPRPPDVSSSRRTTMPPLRGAPLGHAHGDWP